MDLALQARSLIAQAGIQEGLAARSTGIAKANHLLKAKQLREQAQALNAPINFAAENEAARSRLVLPYFDKPYVASGPKGETVLGSLSRFQKMAAFVRKDLVEPASIVQFDSCVRATLKFPLPCTDVNVEALTYRDDLWLYCRMELARLLLVKPDPNQVQDRNGAYMLAWVDAVYSWISLAFFAANVQPFMLFPEPKSVGATITSGKVEGQCVPVRSGLPPRVFNVKSALRDKLNGAGAKVMYAADPTGFGGYWYGPTWKGFHDRGIYTQREIQAGANAWMVGDFGMDMRQLTEGMRTKVGDEPQYFGAGYVLATLKKSPAQASVMETREGMLAFFEYGAQHLASTIPGVRWQRLSRNMMGDDNTEVISPWGIVQLADAWAYDVVMVPMMEFVTDSFGWYAYNHLPFFAARGDLSSMSTEDILAMQQGIRSANIAVKEQKLDTAMASIAAVAAVIGAAIPVWGTLVAAIVIALAVATQFIAKAIFRRKAPKPQCPQPPVLRSLSDARCDLASTSAPLGELNAMNQRFLAAEARESIMGGPSEQSFGSGGFSVSPTKQVSPATIAAGVGVVLAVGYLLRRK